MRFSDSNKYLTRRRFVARAAVGLVGATAVWAAPEILRAQNAASSSEPASDSNAFPPTRAITSGPKFHWGAYYDQIHFDPTNRFVVGNEVDFKGRSPRPDDRIRVGLIDTQDGDRWIEIGSSVAWNWQQGCMLQWRPGPTPEVVWNDRKDDRFFATILNWETGERRALPAPIYALSPDGKFALFPDFRRLNDRRPGYGYCGVPDPNADKPAPENAGIWRMDIESGKVELLFSFADIAAIPPQTPFPKNVKHWFNHLIVAPDSKRFLFLHRWQREEGSKRWFTRLMTANVDGSDPFVLNPEPMTSHLVWRDPERVIAFANRPSDGDRFYLFTDKTDEATVYGKDIMKVDGHVSYVPNTNCEWILNDSYPQGKARIQTPFLFHLPTEKFVPIGAFPSPIEYVGEWRCDLHPRCSRDGKKVLIDGVSSGERQIYLVDIEGLCEI